MGSLQPRADNRFLLHGLNLSRKICFTKKLYDIARRVAGWDPYTLHDLRTIFLEWICSAGQILLCRSCCADPVCRSCCTDPAVQILLCRCRSCGADPAVQMQILWCRSCGVDPTVKILLCRDELFFDDIYRSRPRSVRGVNGCTQNMLGEPVFSGSSRPVLTFIS